MNYREVTMVRCDECGKLYEPYGKPHKCKGVIEVDCRNNFNCHYSYWTDNDFQTSIRNIYNNVT